MGKRKPRKNEYSNYNNFAALPRKTLKSKEWAALSPGAKLFYIHLKAKYNKKNNGQIHLSYSELKGNKGIGSSSTISNAIQELEEKGWINRKRRGGMYRYSNLFTLTGKYDDHI